MKYTTRGRKAIVGVLSAIGAIGSLAMIFYSAHFLKCVETATGWSAAGYFLLAVVLLGVGFVLLGKLDKVLERT